MKTETVEIDTLTDECDGLKTFAALQKKTASELSEQLTKVTAHRDGLITALKEREIRLFACERACKSVVDTWEKDFMNMDTGYEGTNLETDYKLCKAAIAWTTSRETKQSTRRLRLA